MLIVLAQDLPLPLLWLTALLGGACLELFGLVWINTLQQLVPRELLGRVFSVDQLGSFALLPLAYAGAGWAANEWGAQQVLLTGGLITTSLSVIGLTLPSVRRLD
jgi:DHA3 family tetracycline resistance protein-like MFS transporter